MAVELGVRARQGCVDVWRVDLRAVAWRRLERRLSVEESRRAGRFRFARHRRRFAVSRVALRSLLGAAAGLAPEKIRYRTGPRGKPTLADADAGAIRFNLSRSGDLALIALTHGREVGVDVEAVSVHPEADAVARSYFAAEEVAFVAVGRDPDRARDFLRVWTRKEAVLKAAGTGLVEEMARFSVLPCAPGWTRVRVASTFDGLLREVDVDRAYVAALALQGQSHPDVRVHDLCIGDLAC